MMVHIATMTMVQIATIKLATNALMIHLEGILFWDYTVLLLTIKHAWLILVNSATILKILLSAKFLTQPKVASLKMDLAATMISKDIALHQMDSIASGPKIQTVRAPIAGRMTQ
jgi:hypothetical protein